MKKITAVIIAKNEEDMIADCIESIGFCDEIVVIDGESIDRTAEIAEKLKTKVYSHPFTDFASARNFALQKAMGDWIFYIDADERVDKTLQESMLALKGESMHDAYNIKRKNFYLGKHEWPYIESLERVFKKNALKGWQGVIHESPHFDGTIGTLKGFLHHYTHRNLSAMVEKTIVWSTVEAQLRFSANHPAMSWWRFPRVMISAFYNSFIMQKGYKAGIIGIIESMYQAFSMFITYAKLHELQYEKKI